MESESGAKIAIRGKGSVKEGKGRSDAAAMSNLEEDLHCLVTADSEEKVSSPTTTHPFLTKNCLLIFFQVAKAIAAIERIIETAASTPEAQNELKKNQLRMLATLNGTLRDDEGQACQNCTYSLVTNLILRLGGEIGHRKYDCPQTRNFNAGIVCHRCGQAGHFARDCKAPLSNQQGYGGGTAANNGDLQKEMEDFMAEIGAAGTGGYGQSAGRIESGQPSPWQQQPQQQVVASVAPWVRYLPPLPYFKSILIVCRKLLLHGLINKLPPHLHRRLKRFQHPLHLLV